MKKNQNVAANPAAQAVLQKTEQLLLSQDAWVGEDWETAWIRLEKDLTDKGLLR